MELYSLTTGIIGQQGRRGALMITISDSHPDVLDFCKIKRDRTPRYANISVRVTDSFMRAVERPRMALITKMQKTDRGEKNDQGRESGRTHVGARDWAEPGCLFWDTIRAILLLTDIPEWKPSTNPCAEEP
jgi:ribonucleoside-diphosphate reductase alpha chain